MSKKCVSPKRFAEMSKAAKNAEDLFDALQELTVAARRLLHPDLSRTTKSEHWTKVAAGRHDEMRTALKQAQQALAEAEGIDPDDIDRPHRDYLD